MDTKPHTHTPKIRGDNGFPWELFRYRYRILYGDTTVYIKGGRNPSQEQLKEALSKAVLQHDKGSEHLFDPGVTELVLRDKFYGIRGKWGSEILKLEEETTEDITPVGTTH